MISVRMSRPSSIARRPTRAGRRLFRDSGRNLWNSTAEITGIVSVSGIIQALNSANALRMGANANSMPILATPKAPFSPGTHTARRRPTSTLSWIVNIAVAATARTKKTDWTVSSRKDAECQARTLIPTSDTAASSADTQAA
jgi:hypothetical protein